MDVAGVATLPAPLPSPAVTPVPSVELPGSIAADAQPTNARPRRAMTTGAGYTAAEIALAGRATAYLTAIAVAADLTFDGYA